MNIHRPIDPVADRALRELWKPSRLEQMAAVEILLASSIANELRRELRTLEYDLSTGKVPTL